jgi:hypothetical protein
LSPASTGTTAFLKSRRAAMKGSNGRPRRCPPVGHAPDPIKSTRDRASGRRFFLAHCGVPTSPGSRPERRAAPLPRGRSVCPESGHFRRPRWGVAAVRRQPENWAESKPQEKLARDEAPPAKAWQRRSR